MLLSMGRNEREKKSLTQACGSLTDWNLLYFAFHLHFDVITFDKQLHNVFKKYHLV